MSIAGPAAATSSDYPAPFVAPEMTVDPAWLDYNGHLNMAYYNVLFDRALDEAVIALGLGPDYVAARNMSYFTAEVHVTYLRELHAGDPVRVHVQILDADDKRLHVFEELYHAREHWLSATSEQMSLHVDMGAKKVVPWPDDLRARVLAARDAHAHLPRRPEIGHVIGIPRKG